MSISVQEPTRNEDQMIIYPQKPTILAQKRSFTLKNQRFSHKKDHLPPISLNSSIFLSIDP